MSGGLVASPAVSEVAALVLRAWAPLLVAALAVAVASLVLAAWTGIHDPAVTWLLRTTFVGGALVVGAADLWCVGEALFERSLEAPQARDARGGSSRREHEQDGASGARAAHGGRAQREIHPGHRETSASTTHAERDAASDEAEVH